MRLPATFFLLSAILIGVAWWWLGAPVAMPPSPLAAGEKLYCVSYAPFRWQQTPLVETTHVEPSQIDEDFARLARLTDCVRTYSTEHGLDRVPEVAKKHGLKVMQGLWLSGQAARDKIRIDEAVALARQFPDVIRSIVVGNEVLLRGEMTGEALAAAIRGVKTQVPMPVTYADVWEFWLRHPEVQAAVDFVTIHILPYWEDFPIAAPDAGAHVDSIRAQVARRFPDKEILIGETGWPSAGRMREAALPSPANQARVIHEVLEAAKRGNYRVNVIEAFDQPWKRALEGTVGGHWGFLDAETREFKFGWGSPVSNHPRAAWQAAGGVILAGLIFASALAACGGAIPASGRLWAGVAACAVGCGILTPWAILNVPVESLGVGGWLRSLALVAVAIGSPLAGAAMLARGQPAPAFAQILARRETRLRDPLALAAGFLLAALSVLAIVIALGLLFDPRYKDFPFAPLTAATVPFVVLSFLVRREGVRGASETAVAATLALSIVYIAFNESFANWQALWVCAVFALLALTLWRVRGPAAPG